MSLETSEQRQACLPHVAASCIIWELRSSSHQFRSLTVVLFLCVLETIAIAETQQKP